MIHIEDDDIDETYMICPTCDCMLDLGCYPKCFVCQSIRQCINCTKSRNILAVDKVVLTICDHCILTHTQNDLNNLHQFKIKKSNLSKKILKLKQRYFQETFHHNLTHVVEDPNTYIITKTKPQSPQS
jgi:hypothetical protein